MKVIAIEEHWTSAGIDRALRAQPAPAKDDSLVLNDRGDIPERLLDLGEMRIAAMDAAGIDTQIVSVAPPGTGGLPPAESVALSREANDLASAAAGLHPGRLRAMATLPLADPDAALAELERTATDPAHVGVMTYGRAGERPLDDPAFDEVLASAARLGRPVFIHPQIPPRAVREASYDGIEETIDLSLATFGWGWHLEAGTAAIRLILRGTFDRNPELQIVLGHWGEMALFALDRVDLLSNVAPKLERRVADYFQTNVHITSSGMMYPRLLRHALDFVGPERILLSGDYPFHVLEGPEIARLLDELPEADREKVAHGNAESLFGFDS